MRRNLTRLMDYLEQTVSRYLPVEFKNLQTSLSKVVFWHSPFFKFKNEGETLFESWMKGDFPDPSWSICPQEIFETQSGNFGWMDRAKWSRFVLNDTPSICISCLCCLFKSTWPTWSPLNLNHNQGWQIKELHISLCVPRHALTFLLLCKIHESEIQPN